ncbi:hypothetical protein LZ198_26800 [Myxococcus sp. K15C18031901]|uniref:hypothetical protein n=1 Tax=Myxococcus dinghuensis TaxID=2906761 RepID=UPI0020A7FA25|nr:hypothetical protein [Myxococcus dinghuensis]MCP3102488.1 hypothetical protein [Myxococcus dinghuensis]
MSATLHIYPAPSTPREEAWHYRFECAEGHGESGAIDSLDTLAEVLRRWGRHLADQPWTVLPTFGGAAPARTEDVWSWDATRVLSGPEATALVLQPRTRVSQGIPSNAQASAGPPRRSS